jgi:hypothetical protein
MTQDQEHHEHHQPGEMPRWVPVTIGVVLVSLAVLAVVTGLRYRGPTLVNMINPRANQPRATSPAPPGEAEAGGSLVSSAVPAANEAVSSGSRAEITGDASGINAVVKMWARRGMKINATPRDASVFVNDMAVGTASQFDSEDEVYDFPAPGSYTVKLIAHGYKERHFIVTSSESAQDEIADIKVKLEKE